METDILHTLVYSLTSDITKSCLQVTQKHQWCSCSTLKNKFRRCLPHYLLYKYLFCINLSLIAFEHVWGNNGGSFVASAETCGFFFATVEKNVKKKNWSRNLTTAEAIVSQQKNLKWLSSIKLEKVFALKFFWSGHSTNSGGALKLLHPFVGLDSLANYVAKKLLKFF